MSRSSSAGPVRVALATIGGNLYLIVGTLVFGLATGLGGLVLPPGRVFRWTSERWGRSVLAASGIRLEARYDCDLAAAGRTVLMPNHQSLYDIPALLATLPGQTRFLAKQSLFRIPIFGWSLRTGGFIPVDRGNRRQAREVFQRAIDGLGAGDSILIFPEETRTTDGRLGEFKKGGFLLALRSGLPIVPVGIRGNFEVRPKGSWVIRPGRVTVHYGCPIGAEDYSVREIDRFMAAVRSEMARLAAIEEGSER
ncbi:MAG: lysophospholipid acyltransferase family protein [Thermoanaerobaculia bacterium]|nr:lysophospholipid acyltransferase family protein [Thermoanaerobaculia bacterium]